MKAFGVNNFKIYWTNDVFLGDNFLSVIKVPRHPAMWINASVYDDDKRTFSSSSDVCLCNFLYKKQDFNTKLDSYLASKSCYNSTSTTVNVNRKTKQQPDHMFKLPFIYKRSESISRKSSNLSLPIAISSYKIKPFILNKSRKKYVTLPKINLINSSCEEVTPNGFSNVYLSDSLLLSLDTMENKRKYDLIEKSPTIDLGLNVSQRKTSTFSVSVLTKFKK